MGWKHAARRLRGRPAGPASGIPPVDASAFASFGARSRIQPDVTVHSPHRIHIGDDVIIRARTWLSVQEEHHDRRYTPELWIGDRTRIGHDCVLACIGEIVIGKDVLTADRVFVSDTYHDYRDAATPVLHQPMADPRPVRIGDGAFIGVNAVILPGVTVGERAYVAASAVVTKDVAPNTVVSGNPARVIRRWDAGTATWLR